MKNSILFEEHIGKLLKFKEMGVEECILWQENGNVLNMAAPLTVTAFGYNYDMYAIYSAQGFYTDFHKTRKYIIDMEDLCVILESAITGEANRIEFEITDKDKKDCTVIFSVEGDLKSLSKHTFNIRESDEYILLSDIQSIESMLAKPAWLLNSSGYYHNPKDTYKRVIKQKNNLKLLTSLRQNLLYEAQTVISQLVNSEEITEDETLKIGDTMSEDTQETVDTEDIPKSLSTRLRELADQVEDLEEMDASIKLEDLKEMSMAEIGELLSG